STYNPSGLSLGAHNVSGAFTAATIDTIPYLGSTSSTVPLTVVTPVATTLVLNSVSPNSVDFGSAGPVTFTATLTRNDTSAGVVGATISFTVAGTGGSTVTATTGASGVATFSTYNLSALAVGTHNVQASFTAATVGGTVYAGNTSGTLPLMVITPTTLTL